MRLRARPFESSATYHEWFIESSFLSLGFGLPVIFKEEAVYGKLIENHTFFRPELWTGYADRLSSILTDFYVTQTQDRWLEKVSREDTLMILRGGARRSEH